jgi:hypothetical protein
VTAAGVTPAGAARPRTLQEMKVRLAAAEALAALGQAAAGRAREEMRAEMARMRNEDKIKSMGVQIGDLDLGVIKIPVAAGGTTPNEDVIDALAKAAPAEDGARSRYVDPAALKRQDVLDTLEAMHPDLVTVVTDPAWRGRLLRRLDKDGTFTGRDGKTWQVATPYPEGRSAGSISFTATDIFVPAMVGLIRSQQIDPGLIDGLLPFAPQFEAIPGDVEDDGPAALEPAA